MKPINRSRPLRAQQGFTLIELGLVLALMGILAILAFRDDVANLERAQAQTAADQMNAIGSALATCLGRNPTLYNGSPVSTPTIADLKSANCLSTAVSDTTRWGSPYTLRVIRVGATAPYNFEALVTTDQPWVINGKTRTDLVGLAASKIGGFGGLTGNYGSGLVASGGKGAWEVTQATYPNITAAGQLAYFVSQSALPWDSTYLRIDGGNQMLADLRMNGNNIAAAKDVNATGNITAPGTGHRIGALALGTGNVALTEGAANTLRVTTGAAGALKTVDFDAAGNVIANDGGVVAAGRVQGKNGVVVGASGNVLLSEATPNELQVGYGAGRSATFRSSGDFALATGALEAQSDVRITSLGSASRTTSLAALTSPTVLVGTFNIGNAVLVPMPACLNPTGGAAGTPRIRIQSTAAKGPINSARWGYDLSAQVSGSNWVISATNNDGPLGGTGTPLDAYNGSPGSQSNMYEGTAYVFCDYKP